MVRKATRESRRPVGRISAPIVTAGGPIFSRLLCCLVGIALGASTNGFAEEKLCRCVFFDIVTCHCVLFAQYNITTGTSLALFARVTERALPPDSCVSVATPLPPRVLPLPSSRCSSISFTTSSFNHLITIITFISSLLLHHHHHITTASLLSLPLLALPLPFFSLP